MSIIILLAGLCAGCGKNSDQGTNDITPASSSEEPSVTVTAAPEPSVTVTAAPEPTEDPAKAEALRIAELHGLSEADIRGEYALLVRFSETVEQNERVGDYREFLYKIFPVV